MIKLLVLGRDGVINQELPGPVTSPDDWVPIPGSLEAIARLHQAGWHIAVATNQSGIERGLLGLDALHDIHQRMHEMVNQAGGKIDVVAFCPHTEANPCTCRKPSPGMLYSIYERLDVDPATVVVVGDSLMDMQAAMATASTPIIVRTGRGQDTLDSNNGLEHIPAYDDLASYVTTLLEPKEEG